MCAFSQPRGVFCIDVYPASIYTIITLLSWIELKWKWYRTDFILSSCLILIVFIFFSHHTCILFFHIHTFNVRESGTRDGKKIKNIFFFRGKYQSLTGLYSLRRLMWMSFLSSFVPSNLLKRKEILFYLVFLFWISIYVVFSEQPSSKRE